MYLSLKGLEMENKNKVYLGDGVYISFDGYQLCLTTEDGISATNTIYMEPEVLRSLEDYVKELKTIIKWG